MADIVVTIGSTAAYGAHPHIEDGTILIGWDVGFDSDSFRESQGILSGEVTVSSSDSPSQINTAIITAAIDALAAGGWVVGPRDRKILFGGAV